MEMLTSTSTAPTRQRRGRGHHRAGLGGDWFDFLDCAGQAAFVGVLAHLLSPPLKGCSGPCSETYLPFRFSKEKPELSELGISELSERFGINFGINFGITRE